MGNEAATQTPDGASETDTMVHHDAFWVAVVKTVWACYAGAWGWGFFQGGGFGPVTWTDPLELGAIVLVSALGAAVIGGGMIPVAWFTSFWLHFDGVYRIVVGRAASRTDYDEGGVEMDQEISAGRYREHGPRMGTKPGRWARELLAAAAVALGVAGAAQAHETLWKATTFEACSEGSEVGRETHCSVQKAVRRTREAGRYYLTEQACQRHEGRAFAHDFEFETLRTMLREGRSQPSIRLKSVKVECEEVWIGQTYETE